jgi:dual-specificity kinase
MGEGTFAKVVNCVDREQDRNVAVKIVRAVDKYTEAAEIEIEILNEIGGKSGCIELIHSFEFKKHMCLVFPKYGSSLFDFLKHNRYRGFSVSNVRDIGYQLLKALKCMYYYFIY